ncbi:MAG: hypothetical protein ACYTKD_30695, partial [Planctomycetota bacterium]
MMAAVAIALLSAMGCGEKPGGQSTDDAAGGGAGTGGPRTVKLAPRSLGDAELALFMPRGAALKRSPPAGTMRLPEAGGGELRYGVLRVAARGDRPEGQVRFAVLTPAPADGEGAWLLFVDRDLDGDLAEERPLEARPRTEEMDVGGRKVRASGARFPTVRTDLPGGGSHAYVVNAYRSSGRSMADVRSAVALSARVDILGAERAVVVYDSNANARFGDLYRGALIPTDDIGIDLDGDGRIVRDEIRPLAQRVYRDGLSAAVSVAEDAGAITVESLDVKTGAISRAGAAAGEDVLVELSSPEYGLLWSLEPDRLPEGKHAFAAYGITRGGAEGEGEWVLSGKWLTRPGPIVEVPPDGTLEVGFGPPLTARAAVAFIEGARRAIVKVVFAGSAREDAAVLAGDGKPRLGRWRVIDPGDAGNDGAHGSGELYPGPLPGLWLAEWRAPAGLEKGRRLVFEIVPDLGPFAGEFDGRTPFEYGVSTKVTLVVIGVEVGSQAETAGVERGDEIVSYDGREVRNEIDMSLAVRDAVKKAVGTVELVVRRWGELKRFDVKP